MEISVVALIVYFLVIIASITIVRLNISEAMLIGFGVLCLFGGSQILEITATSLAEAFTDPIVASVVLFVFMAQLFNRTGIIRKQIEILNSLVGRLPGSAGYVATIASGLFGSVSHGGSANAAAIGSVAIPWMKRTGWRSSTAATLIAGNSGIGHVIPPSPSLLILLGMPVVSSVVGLGELFIPLFIAAAWIMVYRIIVAFFLIRRDRVQGLSKHEIPSFVHSLTTGWSSLLIYTGILVPILIEIGPIAEWVESRLGEDGHSAINIIIWIPVLMLLLTLALGRRDLNLSPRGFVRLMVDSIPGYVSVGTTVLFAFAAANVLTKLGLGDDLSQMLAELNAGPWLLLVLIGVVIILVAGPLPASATTATLGGVSFTALVEAGVHPAMAVAAFLTFASTEGASPPAGAPIYIASGIAGNNPAHTFVRLIFLYVAPFLLLGVAFGLGLLPILF